MAKVTVVKEKNYTTIDNGIFRDTRISFKAKGLLTTMLSLPPTWNYTIEGLAALGKDGKDSIKTALKELEDFGYLERKQTRNKNGSFCDLEYFVYEKPQPKEPLAGNPPTDKSVADFPMQLNTYILTKEKENTDKLNTKELNTDLKEQEEKKGRNNSKNCKVETSVPEKQKHTPKKSKYETYLELKEKEKDMLNRVYDICRKDHSLSEDTSLEVVKIIDYYLSKYTQKTGNIHPILGDKALSGIISVLYNTVDTEYGHFENLVEDDGYMDIIDEFFKTDFGQRTGERTDYHLSHFATEGVISRLVQRLV